MMARLIVAMWLPDVMGNEEPVGRILLDDTSLFLQGRFPFPEFTFRLDLEQEVFGII